MSTIETRLSLGVDAQQLVDIDNSGIWNDSNAPVELAGKTAEEYALQNPPGTQIVATKDGFVCGYVGFRAPTPLPSNQHVTQLDIGVHPDYQGFGVGRKLIEAAKAYAAEQGKHKLSLRVMATNTKAIAFYQSCGFIEQGRLIDEFYVGGRYVDDIMMYVLL
ncbi:ribosomal protein S18 acetylase RimI-like enzyme [Paenibacillus phyllosphaerae]|uniref:Ribosomal protein S18 acetylase RimI-like enzyme n=1 Tax=Paenibacillus phyllosphaerae TaxID=274593 RepID=A0A7W5B066_9BACL|nr:ribosomal protein S18 acetylase RimI-like enzyme [Paenibacillus phyllosphaerae]